MDVDNKERYADIVNRILPDVGGGLSIGDGWADLVIQLDKDIAEIDPDYKLYQCKEKFGGLRYYIGHDHNDKCGHVEGTWGCEVYTLIDRAEAESTRICELCGKPGILRDGGWIRTLCKDHSEGRPPWMMDEDRPLEQW